MHFVISKNNFVEGLSSVLQVIPAKSTLPILSNIKLVTEDGRIVISATDLNMGIQTTAQAEIIEAGQITIPAKRMGEIVRELPDQPIDFKVEGMHITIECSRGIYQMIGMDADEYPAFPEMTGGYELEIKSETFFRLVNNTIYAVSTDEMRPALNGVYWKLTDEQMIMVATDGHRLAKIERTIAEDDVKSATDAPGGIIIPPKPLTQASRLLSEFETFKILISHNFILFRAADFIIFSRLIEGDYVSYDQVIPLSNTNVLKVNRNNLLHAIKRVAILANQLTHQISFFVRPDLIQLAVNTPDLGEANEDVEAEYVGDDMDIGYNAQYLIDILNHIDSDYVLFKLGNSNAAAIIEPDGGFENEEFKNLIMPIRLSD